ncbi:MAG: hypothetical protein HYU35_01465 [Parcubacteria group bacterium]|nr:hypothetical protein [Parcubacteria group bacterium]
MEDSMFRFPDLKTRTVNAMRLSAVRAKGQISNRASLCSALAQNQNVKCKSQNYCVRLRRILKYREATPKFYTPACPACRQAGRLIFQFCI